MELDKKPFGNQVFNNNAVLIIVLHFIPYNVE